MRIIGYLDKEVNARKFGDYLFTQGIDNEIESEKEGSWAVWVHSEEQMDQARKLLGEFQSSPADVRFEVGNTAENLRRQRQKEQNAYQKRLREPRQIFRSTGAYGFGRLTAVIVGICVVVYFLEWRLGDPVFSALTISNYEPIQAGMQGMLAALVEIQHGQIWRLVTPILLHYGILHILFNMLWMRDLGSMIEVRQGSLKLAGLVLSFAVLSNLGQYFLAGPNFGGMSGVVYGLAGYIWIRGQFDPGSGLFLHPTTVTMLVVWFFLGFTPILGHVANWAHGFGFAAGIAWGYLSSLHHR